MIEHSFTPVMRTKLATTKMTTTTKISLEQLQSKANKNKETPSKINDKTKFRKIYQQNKNTGNKTKGKKYNMTQKKIQFQNHKKLE